MWSSLRIVEIRVHTIDVLFKDLSSVAMCSIFLSFSSIRFSVSYLVLHLIFSQLGCLLCIVVNMIIFAFLYIQISILTSTVFWRCLFPQCVCLWLLYQKHVPICMWICVCILIQFYWSVYLFYANIFQVLLL